jgi:tRNA(fMet)-specific endonuclease VapC
MRYIIDTSAYSHFNRGDTRIKHLFVNDNEFFIPLIVVGELRAGFAAGTKTATNEKILQEFLDEPNVQTLSLSNKSTIMYAQAYQQLRKIGRPIGSNDLWIAALAMEHNLPLITMDSDFKHVAGIQLVKF